MKNGAQNMFQPRTPYLQANLCRVFTSCVHLDPPHLGKKPGTIWPTKLDIQLDVQFYKIIFKQCLNLILAPPFFKKVDFF